ncbi:MAG: DNA-deoxyinosine glycosylase [Clostridiaceae bacterium]|nr:DNA-deoxyinosine glycosylase [Clostridiaceae bacterium]
MDKEANGTQRVSHPFAPVYDTRSRVLILGSMPSVLSRRSGFYYGHPQNRFWQVLADLYQTDLPRSRPEKEGLLLDHHLALWDVLESCEIQGSADSSIRLPRVNDLSPILSAGPIQAIIANGQTAAKLYAKYIQPATGRPCLILPSTSPANGHFSLADLCAAWRILLPLTQITSIDQATI